MCSSGYVHDIDKRHITIGLFLHPSQFMGLSVHVAMALFQTEICLKGKVAFGLFGNLSKELVLVGLEMPRPNKYQLSFTHFNMKARS